MKFPHFQCRLLATLPLFHLVSCVSGADSPQAADIDFMAVANDGHTYTFDLDGAGKASMEPIGFLENEFPTRWDAVGLDQVVIAKATSGKKGVFDIKYYKNKISAKTFEVTNADILVWLILIPEKNCLIVDVMDNGAISRLVAIDLNSGEQKIVQLAKMTSIDSKPVLEKANGELICVLTGHLNLSINKGLPYDSLARLNPSDLSIKDVVPIDDSGIQGLLFADASGQHVTAYGMIGGAPFYDPGASANGTPGFIEFDMATGKPTMIMKDTSKGIFWYLHTGIAAINNRYVVMTKAPRPPLDFDGFRTYCVDLQEKSAVQLSGIPAFAYPISHDGLLLATPTPSNQPIASPAYDAGHSAGLIAGKLNGSPGQKLPEQDMLDGIAHQFLNGDGAKYASNADRSAYLKGFEDGYAEAFNKAANP